MVHGDYVCIAAVGIESLIACYYNITFHFMKRLLYFHFYFLCVGYTPLHMAAHYGSTDVLDTLLNVADCDINVKVIYTNLVLVSLFSDNKVF